MTQEQKAKAYDEAKARMSRAFNSNRCTIGFMNEIFPELKESEDERIRKWIIAQLEIMSGSNDINRENMMLKAITWLEKQCEQEPTDKVEYLIPQKGEYYVCIKDYCPVASNYSVNTKDKIYKSPRNGYINNDKGVGLSWTNSCTEAYFSPVKDEDWIVCENNNVIGEPIQYKTLKSNKVLQKAIKSLEDNNFVIKLRFWSINDAKDGDVLYHKAENGIEYIVMSKGLNDHSNIDSYFRYNSINGFGIDIPSVLSAKCDSITPATKEQRDLLFQKMREAGYEWDAEKKELKKIELNEWVPKNGDVCRPKKGGNNIILCEQDGIVFSFVEEMKNGYAGGEISIPILLRDYELVEPKDYNTFDIPFGARDSELQEASYHIPEGFHAEIDGNKVAIKKGEQKPAWSEEGEQHIRTIIRAIHGAGNITPIEGEFAEKWLKSLKDRMKGE